MCHVVARMSLDRDDEAKLQFESLIKANPASDLDHFVECSTVYSSGRCVGAELPYGLCRLRNTSSAKIRTA